MHCLLHLNESLNLEDFLSLSHQQNASVSPFWSFIDRNDRFPTLSHASNNEIQAIFLKPVKGTPFVHSSPPPRCSAQRNNLVQQETRVLNIPFVRMRLKQKVLITTITLENSSKNTGYFWKPRLFCIGLS